MTTFTGEPPKFKLPILATGPKGKNSQERAFLEVIAEGERLLRYDVIENTISGDDNTVSVYDGGTNPAVGLTVNGGEAYFVLNKATTKTFFTLDCFITLASSTAITEMYFLFPTKIAPQTGLFDIAVAGMVDVSAGKLPVAAYVSGEYAGRHLTVFITGAGAVTDISFKISGWYFRKIVKG